MITVAVRDKDGVAMVFRVSVNDGERYLEAVDLVRAAHPGNRVCLAAVGELHGR